MPAEDLEARLRALEDRADISQLRAHFCELVDERRWRELADTFTAARLHFFYRTPLTEAWRDGVVPAATPS